MDQQQALKDDVPKGPREVKPVQFFGDNTSGALGVTEGKDFRPKLVKVTEEDDVPGEITHTFAAEPGEPGVPVEPEAPATDDDDDDTDEEPAMSLLDAPPPAAEPQEDATDPEVQTDDG